MCAERFWAAMTCGVKKTTVLGAALFVCRRCLHFALRLSPTRRKDAIYKEFFMRTGKAKRAHFYFCSGLALPLFLAGGQAHAQGKESGDELAKQLSNPMAALI